MWIDSSWEIVLKALAHLWYWVSSDREYPSLIKWWQANFNIHCATKPVLWPSEKWQLWVWMGKTWLLYALATTKPWWIIVHNFEHWEQWVPEIESIIKEHTFTVYYIPTREIIRDLWVHTVYENTIMIGVTARLLGMNFETIKDAMFYRYGKKKALWEMNVTCLEHWYESIDEEYKPLPTIESKPTKKRIVLDWNTALAMGAIHAWVRNYFAYPMSPSSSILWYLAKVAPQTWMVVRQVEDEISAVQMALWSMYAWTRSMTATSWWWFDLMTETISLSWMTEVPLVVAIAQRPWPATWLPTWTAQWDLNMAIYSWHWEYARVVCAVSDQTSAFETTQHAFNLAEKFQIPVIILTEKQIAENRATVPVFEQGTIPIERGLVVDKEELQNLVPTDRYKLTDTWVSKRWIPWASETICFSNGDEHHEDGTLDESEWTAAMIEKRIKKLHTIEWALPEPEIFGNTDASLLYIGWGSSKWAVRDAIDESWNKAAYCHCEFLFPLKRDALSKIFDAYKTIVVVENNATGQFCGLLKQELWDKYTFESLVKSNGRHILVEEILEDITTR